MIEFKGELSEKAKKYVLNCNTFGSVCVWMSIAIIGSAITIAVALLTYKIILVFLVPFAFVACIGFIPLKKEVFQRVPKSILIESGIIHLENDLQEISNAVENVKKVYDMGDWYHIIFYFPHKSIFFICQKDLLTAGSLEEFEKIFEGKIVRKI